MWNRNWTRVYQVCARGIKGKNVLEMQQKWSPVLGQIATGELSRKLSTMGTSNSQQYPMMYKASMGLATLHQPRLNQLRLGGNGMMISSSIHTDTSEENKEAVLQEQLGASGIVENLDLERSLLEASCAQTYFPIAKMEELLYFSHSALDLPWWAAFAGGGLLLRAVLAPFQVMQMRNTANMQTAKPEIDALMQKVKEAQAKGDYEYAQKSTQELQKVWKKYDIHPAKALVNALVQLPLSISLFFAIQNLANASLPSIKSGGALWFPDLTVADPMYVLPVLCGGSILVILEQNRLQGAFNAQPQMVNFMRLFAIVIIPLTAQLNAASTLFICSQSAFNIVQFGVLGNQKVREYLSLPKIAPATTPAPSSAPPPPDLKRPTKLYQNKPKIK